MRKKMRFLCAAAAVFLLLGSLFPLLPQTADAPPLVISAVVAEDPQPLGEITAGTVVEQPLPSGALHDIRLIFGTYGHKVTSHLLV